MPVAEIDRITTVLKQNPKIKLALLFGSVAKGAATAGSDLDIAVLCKQPIDIEFKSDLIHALALAIGRPVDLIDLKTAGQPLLGEILSQGKRILGEDRDYAQLLYQSLIDTQDFLPYRQRILSERKARWLKQ